MDFQSSIHISETSSATHHFSIEMESWELRQQVVCKVLLGAQAQDAPAFESAQAQPQLGVSADGLGLEKTF